MDKAAGTGEAAPPHRGLPDEIVIWEILVHLHPKALLRCRAVCRAWRHATFTHKFLLAHHDRQPTFPIIYNFNSTGNDGGSLGIIAIEQRAAVSAADQLQFVAQLGYDHFVLQASCDGLLVLSINERFFCICNPATRQYALLQMHHDFMVVGMYPHPPSGEYRLLLNIDPDLIYDELPLTVERGFHVFTIGFGQPPRHIGFSDKGETIYANKSVLSHHNLHWYGGQMIMAFDTATESFRHMHLPIVCSDADLFEIDGILGMYNLNDEAMIMDIWMMRDYEGEVWNFKHRVELPLAKAAIQFEDLGNYWGVVAASLDGDVIVLAKHRFGDLLLQIDTDGKQVACFHRRGLHPSQFQLKQTLVQHTFFPTLEGYVVNALPFL